MKTVERIERGVVVERIEDRDPRGHVDQQLQAPGVPELPPANLCRQIVEAIKGGDVEAVKAIQRKHGIANVMVAEIRRVLDDADSCRGQIQAARRELVDDSGGKLKAEEIAKCGAGLEALEHVLARKQNEIRALLVEVQSRQEELTKSDISMAAYRDAQTVLAGEAPDFLSRPEPSKPFGVTAHPLWPALVRAIKAGEDVDDLAMEIGISTDGAESMRNVWKTWQRMLAEREKRVAEIEKLSKANGAKVAKIQEELKTAQGALWDYALRSQLFSYLGAKPHSRLQSALAELRDLAARYPNIITLEGDEKPPVIPGPISRDRGERVVH